MGIVNFKVDSSFYNVTVFNFFEEGQYEKFDSIMSDMPFEYRLGFIKGQYTIKGQSPELYVVENEAPRTEEEINEIILTGILTMFSSTNYSAVEYMEGKDMPAQTKAQFDVFQRYFPLTKEEIRYMLMDYVLQQLGYIGSNKIYFGDSYFIMPTGMAIAVPTMGHAVCFRELKEYGLVDAVSEWEENTIIKISSGQITGHFAIMSSKRAMDSGMVQLTKAQFDVLWKNRNNLCFYNDVTSVASCLRYYHATHFANGTKHSNLLLAKCEGVNVPTMYTSVDEAFLDNEVIALRSSPLKSMAGVLDSYFGINKAQVKSLVDEMESKFNKFASLKNDNRFGYFFQREVEGLTGVAHYDGENFSYALSKHKDVIVGGNVGDVELTQHQLDLLFEQLNILKNSFLVKQRDKRLQVEFVIDGEVCTIVQWRYLSVTNRKHIVKGVKEGYIFEAKCLFDTDMLDLTLDEVYICDSEQDTTNIIGKEYKAVILTKDVEFAHILALANSLNIAAVYAFEGELPKEFRLECINGKAYFYKKA